MDNYRAIPEEYRIRLENRNNLVDADLHNVDLRMYPNLSEIDFSNANLEGSNLEGVDLSSSIFTNTNIRGAIFKSATLENVNFSDIKNNDLTGVDFTYTKFVSSDFQNLDFTVALSVKGMHCDGCSFVESILTNVDFSLEEGDLHEPGACMFCSFSKAVLEGVNFSGCDLFGSFFKTNDSRTNMNRAILNKANCMNSA